VNDKKGHRYKQLKRWQAGKEFSGEVCIVVDLGADYIATHVSTMESVQYKYHPPTSG